MQHSIQDLHPAELRRLIDELDERIAKLESDRQPKTTMRIANAPVCIRCGSGVVTIKQFPDQYRCHKCGQEFVA